MTTVPSKERVVQGQKGPILGVYCPTAGLHP